MKTMESKGRKKRVFNDSVKLKQIIYFYDVRFDRYNVYAD